MTTRRGKKPMMRLEEHLFHQFQPHQLQAPVSTQGFTVALIPSQANSFHAARRATMMPVQTNQREVKAPKERNIGIGTVCAVALFVAIVTAGATIAIVGAANDWWRTKTSVHAHANASSVPSALAGVHAQAGPARTDLMS